MKKSKFIEKPIAFALWQAETGTRVTELPEDEYKKGTFIKN